MAGQEAIDLLRSIDNSLKALVSAIQPLVMQVRAQQPKPVASDRDLDGKWGNPELKFAPRDWTGPPFKGRRFSECPPDLLDLIANSLDYFARKADENKEVTTGGKPKGDFNRADAARARGWAVRIRSGKHVQRGEPVGVSVTARWAEEGDESGF